MYIYIYLCALYANFYRQAIHAGVTPEAQFVCAAWAEDVWIQIYGGRNWEPWCQQKCDEVWKLDGAGSQQNAGVILLMEEILHHLGCIKPGKWWDKLRINWGRISSINSIVQIVYPSLWFLFPPCLIFFGWIIYTYRIVMGFPSTQKRITWQLLVSYCRHICWGLKSGDHHLGYMKPYK